MAKMSDATVLLRAIIASFFDFLSKIGVIRTDNSDEFPERLQSLFAILHIRQERTPPYKPQNKGAAERTLVLSRGTTVSLPHGVKEGKRERFWAGAMTHTCATPNICETNLLNRRKTPYEL